jgi:cytochrome c biogenesis protein CcmG/thiol:disulfide interchange protein DsbE
MTRRNAPWLALFAALLIFAACGGPPAQPENSVAAPQPAPPPGEVGGALPAFRLQDTAGRGVSSEDFRGKVLLVNYWATWCKPCETEMPGFQQLQDTYGPRGFAVIGIAMDTSANDVAAFARKHGIRYALLMGTPEVQERFGILGIPTTMLVDRQGVVRYKIVGFEYKEAVEAELKKLF